MSRAMKPGILQQLDIHARMLSC